MSNRRNSTEFEFSDQDHIEKEFIEWSETEKIERKVFVGSNTIRQKNISKAGNRSKTLTFGFMKEVFLPFGYPSSVSADYMSYQIWDSFQALFSTLMMAISTQKILIGMGVGDAEASALSGAIAWILKDGISMMSRILFTWITGTNLDDYNKTWRIAADIFNDLSFIVDYSISFFPNFKIYILCISGVLKSIVGVCGGATRMAITQHQARNNNISDVSAKDGSQETLINLLGLVCSLKMLPLLGDNERVTLSIFFALMFGHIYCNWKAVRSLNYETFNMNRLHLVTAKLLESNQILSVKGSNSLEPLIGFAPSYRYKIKMGVPLMKSFTNGCENYTAKYRIRLDNKEKTIYTSLSSEVSTEDILEASIAASIVNNIIHAALFYDKSGVRRLIEDQKLKRAADLLNNLEGSEANVVQSVHEYMANKRMMILNRLKHAGYDLSALHFSVDSWRYCEGKN